jgi:glycosyltransferase involved in cell wall biosynthesis
MKFAFVSEGLPPSWSGQSVVIYRLLKDLDPEEYCLITQDYGQGREHREKKEGRLRAKYYYIPRRYAIPKGWRFSFVRWINIKLRAWQIAQIVRRENCAGVVACPGNFFDLPASFYASRMTGVRFYPYMLDYYSQQSVGYSSEASARELEALMMREATAVIVPNEFMGEELRQRYGVKEIVIVRNPCDVEAYMSPLVNEPNGSSDEFKIIYTGSIYNAHFGAFRNLLSAIERLKRGNIKLHLYTNQSREELEKEGLRGPIILHKAQSLSAMPNIQRQADLLFLPLAFDSPFPELVRTSAPGKTGEYLAAARPVLVHAPPDSFLAWYFRRHDCGLVVDESDPAKLALALETLLDDSNVRQRLALNAWRRAQSDFSIAASQAAFADLLKLKVNVN